MIEPSVILYLDINKLLFDSEKGFFPASGIVTGGREELLVDEVKELG